MDMCRNAGGSFQDVSHCGLLMCPYLETGQVVIEKGLGNHGIWQHQKQYVRIVCKRLLLKESLSACSSLHYMQKSAGCCRWHESWILRDGASSFLTTETTAATFYTVHADNVEFIPAPVQRLGMASCSVGLH